MCSNNSKHGSSPFLFKSFSMGNTRKRRYWLRKRKTDHPRITNEGVQAGVQEMEMENLKLYLENKCIMEENRRLRERALVLGRENLTLLCYLTKQSQ